MGKNNDLQLLKTMMSANIRQYGMFIALIGILIVFSILTATKGITFLTPQNITNIYLQTGYIAVLAVGMVLVIVAGHIDLSVGAIAGFTGAVAAVLQIKMGWNTPVTIVITLVLGAIIGMWQGYWIAYKKIPAFIVSLAGMLIFQGAMLLTLKSQTIAGFNPSFSMISQGYLPALATITTPGLTVGLLGYSVYFAPLHFHVLTMLLAVAAIALFIWNEKRTRATRISYGFDVMPLRFFHGKLVLISFVIALFMTTMAMYRGVPVTVVIVLAVVMLYSFVTTKMTIGRHVYAIGGNLEAAKLSGIDADKTLFMVFVSMGVLAALSGIIFAARMDSATTTAGALFELDAIAAAFIGGASASGGVGSVIGAIIGALVMSTINNGMEMMGLEAYFKPMIKGSVLLAAVWFDISTRSSKK